MLKKYVFLHACQIHMGILPLWTEEDVDSSTPISLEAWTSLCSQYGQLSGEGTVKDLYKQHMKGAISLKNLDRTPGRYTMDDVVILNKYAAPRNDQLLFRRPFGSQEEFLAGTLYDDTPYDAAMTYYLYLNDKPVSMELTFSHKTKVRRISVFRNDASREDILDFLYAVAISTKFLLTQAGFEEVYRILPKSHNPNACFTSCLETIFDVEMLTPNISVKTTPLPEGYVKCSCGVKWRELRAEDIIRGLGPYC